MTSNPNPSLFGQSVTFTATVQDSNGNAITCGTVTFNDGVTPIATGVPLGSPSSDQAAYTTSTLTVGQHSITAIYVPGACGFVTSTSNTVAQSVMAPLKVTPYGIVFPASVFGNTGTTTPARIETALNQSAVAVNIGTITAATTGVSGPSPNFQIVSDTCSEPANPPLAPNASCTFGVTFTATALGNFVGTVSVPSDALNGTQTVTLSGTGTAPLINLSPGLTFPGSQVGQTSAATGSATLTNPNSVGLTVYTITTSGDFGTTPVGTNPCNLTGSTILAPTGSAGSSCTVGVTFTPTAQGTRTGSVNITSNASNAPQPPAAPGMIALKGTGTLSALTLSPGSLSFGIVPDGTTSADKTVTVTNPNTSLGGTVAISGIGTSNGVFGIDSTTCGSSLAPSGTCTINVNFSPTTSGTASGTLNISDNAGNGIQKGTLYGTGN